MCLLNLLSLRVLSLLKNRNQCFKGLNVLIG